MDHVAARCLARTNKMKVLDSQWWAALNDEVFKDTFAKLLVSNDGGDAPPQVDPRPGKTTIEPCALHSKELCLLAHVLATACSGNPASSCQAVEDLGEQVLDTVDSSGLFLKVVGGSKAQVLTVAVRRPTSRDTILEIGTHRATIIYRKNSPALALREKSCVTLRGGLERRSKLCSAQKSRG